MSTGFCVSMRDLTSVFTLELPVSCETDAALELTQTSSFLPTLQVLEHCKAAAEYSIWRWLHPAGHAQF